MILICPECKYPVNYHGENDVDSTTWIRLLSGNNAAECKLSEVKATHAAQRAAAIAHLRQFVEKETWVSTKGVKMPAHGTKHFEQLMMEIWMMADAYRAVSILRERKP